MNTDTAALETHLQRLLGYLEQDPGNARLLTDCIGLCLQLGKCVQAQTLVEHGLHVNADNPELRFLGGTVALRLGKFEEAASIFSALLEAGQDFTALRTDAAFALLHLGRYEAAAEVVRPAAEQYDPIAAEWYVRALHFLGRIDEAIAFALPYMEKHRGHGVIAGLLASLYLDNDDIDNARLWSEVALASGSSAPEALTTSGMLALRDQNADTSRDLFEKALAANPKAGRAWVGRGLSHLINLNLPAADADFSAAIQVMPTHIGTWHAYGWCKLMLGDVSSAKAAFEHAMEMDRNFGETHGALAFVLLGEGNREQAKQFAERAIRLDPESPSARYVLALLAKPTIELETVERLTHKILKSKQAPGGVTWFDVMKKIMEERKKP